MEAEFAIAFNRANANFIIIEKRPTSSCWWPTSVSFDTIPEAEAYLAGLRRVPTVFVESEKNEPDRICGPLCTDHSQHS